MNWWERYKVAVPEGSIGKLRVERFEIEPEEAKFHQLRSLFDGLGSRGVQPGRYTRLMEGRTLWMSDTPAELRDHMAPIHRMEAVAVGGRVLINGLGLGVVLRAALLTPGVSEVDVVECNPDVIELVGPHYAMLALATGTVLRFHEDDAYTIRWPRGVTWDVAWHDIWPNISSDNLEGMGTLHRRYARRTRWQGSWAKAEAQMLRDRDRRAGW